MYNIGVDIGGTDTKIGLVDLNGNIIDKLVLKTDTISGFDKVINDIKNTVDNLINKNDLSISDIETIGFGVPSFISKNGRVTCVNLGWIDIEFVPKINNIFKGVKTYAENDATVAAVAEYRFGSMKNHNDVALMITLGTGVGGGIIINGKPFTGANNMASEIGHIVIGENYYDCNCKTNGCFETFCSATAIIKYAQKLINEGRDSIISNNINSLEDITAKMVFDAYREGDKVSKEVILRFKKYLAIGIGSLINTLDPSIIAIGGGVSKADDIILDGLCDMVRKNVLYKEHDFGEITIATLGNDAGIIGAAFLGEGRI
ncbi:MAG: ROK family protein [Romboutsia sp.]